MIPLPLELVEPLGDFHAAPWADAIMGVQIDSRRIEEGDLFVAIGAGADYRKHAFARGAAATLVPEDAFAALATLGGSPADRPGTLTRRRQRRSRTATPAAGQRQPAAAAAGGCAATRPAGAPTARHPGPGATFA